MLSKTVSRKEFIDILQSQSPIDRYELDPTGLVDISAPHSDELRLIWDDDDVVINKRRGGLLRKMPRVVIVATGQKRDFLAWTWTYIPDVRPLTAYARVLEADEIRAIVVPKTTPTLGGLDEACLGLIIGEASTYIENSGERTPAITPLACGSTYSHAMALALALSIHSEAMIEGGIPEAWTRARLLTRQRPLRLSLPQLGLPWRVVLGLYGNDQGYRYALRNVPIAIGAVCEKLYHDSEVDTEVWDALATEYPSIRDAKREMRGPREARVLFFERFVPSLADARRTDPEFAGFLSGFLASQIGPGTLDYIPLLAPYLDRFPSALLWYGLCSGLQHRSSLWGFSGGLGRRVLREILRKESLSDSPQSDIALAELEILTSSDADAMEFRTGWQGVLAIEILPLVVTTVRWPSRQTDQTELFAPEDTSRELRDLSAQLEELRSKMVQVQKRIARYVGEQESLEWKSGKARRR